MNDIKKIPQDLIYKILDSLGNAVLITDKENKIIYVNQHYTEITEYSSDEVVGKNPNIVKSNKQSSGFYQELWASLKTKGYWEGEIWNRRKSGELFPEWINISTIKNQNGQIDYHIGIFSDISDKKIKDEKTLRYAYYDALTDLPNRRFFIEQLKQAITFCKREKQKLAVLYMDLDKFKMVNDQFGHLVGDQYLCEVANLIKQKLRETEILSRFGGDEFVILLPRIKSLLEVEKFSNRLLTHLHNTSLLIQNETLNIRASLGYAIYPDDAQDMDLLIECADKKMYLSKKSHQ